jgi:hypothetical protein
MTEVSIEKFKKIFSGLDIAYGTYIIEGSRADGKQNGKAAVIHKPPTDELWTKHLKGVEPSLGIIPIRADNTCTWGAIDIDMYPLDHTALVKKIRKLELPLIVFRSKSGGAHCYMFTKEPIAAAAMQKHLKLFAAYLGHSGCEIFPKQTELLIDRGDRGNFLNLPYFGGDNGTRYAFKDNGEAASLDEFYSLYETYAISETDIKEPTPEVGGELVDGPPCLQVLCSQGFPEGTRNNGLFNIGVFLRKAHPDTWEDALMRYNQSYMNPPLPLNELTLVVKQLKKKEYGYKCKDAPINGHCNASLCKTRKYGIGGASSDLPTISSLSKYNAEPPLWFLDVDGRRLELLTEELQQQHKFQVVCMNKINIMPPTLKKHEWETMINGLMKQMVEAEAITDASEDTSEDGRFFDLLEEFCTHLQTAMDREEILMGRPWTHEEEGLTYFRLKDLEAFLLRNKFLMSTVKIAQRLRNIQGTPHSLNIKNRTVRTWRIPAFAKQNEPFNTDLAIKGSPF